MSPNLQDSAKIVRLEEKVKYLEERAERSEKKIGELEGLIQVYQASQGLVKNKLDQIYTAIIGDELGNVGVVTRLKNVELVVEWITAKKNYVWGIIAAAGVVMAAAYWAFEKFFDWIK